MSDSRIVAAYCAVLWLAGLVGALLAYVGF